MATDLKYENSQGNKFATHAEALASNTSLGTNPKASNYVPPIKPGSVDAPQIGNVQAYKLAPPVTQTYGGLESATTAIVETAKTQAETNVEEKKNQADSSMQNYLQELVGSAGISSSVDRTAEDEAKKKSDEYTSQLEQEQLANRRQIEFLQKNNPQGLFGGGLEQEVNRLNRESLSKQADIAILQTSANRNYDTAKSISDRSVELKMEESKIKLEALRFFYQENKADFTKAEDRLYSEGLAKKEREFKKQDELEKSIASIKLEAVKNGLKDLSGFNNIKTLDDALKVAGSYLATPTTDIVKLDNGTTLLIDKKTGKTIKNLGGAQPTPAENYVITKDSLDTLHDGDVVSVIANTIKDSGAKQSQSTNDAINVIAGLQQMVKDSPSGKFVGVNPFFRTPNKLASPEALTNRSNIEAINLKVQQWASGAALTEAQTKQVEKITPRVNDTDKQIKAKINALANYMVSQVSGQLAGQGIGFSMDNIDLFNRKPLDQDPLKVNTPPTVGGQDSLNLFN